MAEGDKARLHAPPNPWVGALIVDERGVIVGEGHTQAPGESHAEIEALRRAGAAARGATMVVTLEPCSHVGRTGPCAEAIIEAGIARVVVATIDPDPRVAGTGIELLKASGVDVEVGVEGGRRARSARRVPLAARDRSTLRRRQDREHPRRDRGDGRRHESVDHRTRRSPRRAPVARAEPGDHRGRGNRAQRRPRAHRSSGRLRDRAACAWSSVAPRRAPRFAPASNCRATWDSCSTNSGRHDVLQVLVEGGPTTTSEFFEAGLVNHVVWYQAPSFAGSLGTLAALKGLSTPTMEALKRGRLMDVRRIGDDIRIDVEVS